MNESCKATPELIWGTADIRDKLNIHLFNLPDLLPRLFTLFSTKHSTSSVQNILRIFNQLHFYSSNFSQPFWRQKLANLSFPCGLCCGSVDAERADLLGCLQSSMFFFGPVTPYNGITPLTLSISGDTKCSPKALKKVIYF